MSIMDWNKWHNTKEQLKNEKQISNDYVLQYTYTKYYYGITQIMAKKKKKKKRKNWTRSGQRRVWKW